MSDNILTSSTIRRLTAGVAVTALLTAGLAAGTGSAAAEGFGSDGGSAIAEAAIAGDIDISDWFTNAPGSADNPTAFGSSDVSATATFGNLEVTKANVGRDTRLAGDTLTYRTTVATTGGQIGEITKLLAIEPNGMRGYFDGAWGGGMLTPVDGSAKVSYTAADGTRKTEAAHLTWTKWTLPDGETVSGWELSTAGWQISATETLVLETTYRWTDMSKMNQVGYEWFRSNIDTGVAMDVPGLGIVAKPAMGMPVSCYKECMAPAGSLPFGS